ncbi:hypothetical protein GOODEAATRI_028832 [Goodea atripinnis]|uniref:Uncharacterized protein n=1 Tax=Goodea atripinnis TaxID=208336 RepID=A0ABV0PHZ7_9TELE
MFSLCWRGSYPITFLEYSTFIRAQVLYHRMRYEYEFYDFIRDQFHLMKKKIGLRSTSRPPAYPPDFLHELALRTPEPLDEDEELDSDLEDANSWLIHP